MRKILLMLLVLVLIPTFANAEERFKAGTWELQIGSDTSDMSVVPAIAYFFADNIEGIIHLAYSKTSYDYPSEYEKEESTVTELMFMPGIVYNLKNDNLKETSVVPFIQGAIVYFSIKEDNKSPYKDVTTDAVGVLFGGGLRFLVGDNASVNGRLDYRILNMDIDDVNADTSVYAFNISYSLFF